MNVSAIHHYIPRFLIRRFADAEGLLYIYNKQTRQTVRKGPGGVFWDLHRNTIPLAGEPGEQMEEIYKALDDRFAKALAATLTAGKLTQDEASDIIMLAATLKWRIPANDGLFDQYAGELGYDKLPISIVLAGSTVDGERTAIDHLTGTPLFQASKRVMFPFLGFHKDRQLDERKFATIFENSYLIGDPRGKSILSDNPIIERQSADVHTFAEQILPLSNTHTYIYNQSGTRRMHPLVFALQRDILLYDQAKTYVVCGDLDYLKAVIDAHDKVPEGGMERMREELFIQN